MAARMRPWRLGEFAQHHLRWSADSTARRLVSATPVGAPAVQRYVAAPLAAELDPSAGAVSARVASATFLLLLAIYAAFGLCLGNAPMQDLPNHLTRAHIIGDLLFNHGARFGNHFVLQPTFSPYIACDLALAGLDRLVGTVWACRLCIAAAMVLLPLGVWFAVRQRGGGRVAAATAGLLALYVATDRFFTLGFANFLFSVACAFFAYGWFCRAARGPTRYSYACFVVLLSLGYAMHLSALIFVLTMAGVSASVWVWQGRLSLQRAATLLLPAVVLLLFQLLLSPGMDVHAGALRWGTWVSKLSWFTFPALRFDLSGDLLLLAMFVAAAIFPIAISWRRRTRAGTEVLLITGALAFIYLVTPSDAGILNYCDVRALHYAALFLVCAGTLYAELRPKTQSIQLAAASLIALANIVYLGAWMLPQNAALGDYRVLAAAIPPDGSVLPIDTVAASDRTRHRYYDPFRHAGSYVTLESGALTPYLFAGNRQPHLPYFRYRDLPYAPSELWYANNARVSWQRVAHRYRYLLVTEPWDRRKIRVPYTVVAQLDIAALLELRDR